jgi:hypothetical protein
LMFNVTFGCVEKMDWERWNTFFACETCWCMRLFGDCVTVLLFASRVFSNCIDTLTGRGWSKESTCERLRKSFSDSNSINLKSSKFDWSKAKALLTKQ